MGALAERLARGDTRRLRTAVEAEITAICKLYQDGRPARPRAQRLLTDRNPTQRSLFDLFRLDRYAPAR